MSETIAFRVPEETKESWKQAVEESGEYANLSHLIKRSVERELANDTHQGDGPSIDDERLGELADTLAQVDSRVAEVAQNVEEVRERSHSVGGGIKQDTLTEVFAVLPVGHEGDHIYTSKVAEETGLDESTAEMALEKLREDMPQSVNRVNFDVNETGWWRQE